MTLERIELLGSFSSEHWKFHVATEKSKKMQQKDFRFLGNFI